MKTNTRLTRTWNALNRREALEFLGAIGAGVGLGVGCSSTGDSASASLDSGAAADAGVPGCVLSPIVTEGPFFVDEKLNRSDLVTGETDGGVTTGYPLTLALSILGITGQACQPLSNAYVDIWHANVPGLYSDEPANFIQSTDTMGQKYLRGFQITGNSGLVTFKTIYPGWYASRTIHIHVKVRLYSSAGDKTMEADCQAYFDDHMNDAVMALPAYGARGPRSIPKNTNDQVYNGTGPGSGIDNVGLPVGQVAPGDATIAKISPFAPNAGSAASLTLGVKLG